MKAFVTFAVFLVAFAAAVRSEDAAAPEAQVSAEPSEGTIKIYKRLIPADVLRGECFFLFLFCIYFQNPGLAITLISN